MGFVPLVRLPPVKPHIRLHFWGRGRWARYVAEVRLTWTPSYLGHAMPAAGDALASLQPVWGDALPRDHKLTTHNRH